MGLISGLFGNASVTSTEDIVEKYNELFIQGEQIEMAFKLIRDEYIFTDKRLIIIDSQSITGKKKSFKTISYKSISRYSIESAGHFDLDAELNIWISGEKEPSINMTFNKKVNIYDVQQILAAHVL